MTRRVVITGIGILSACGNNTGDFLSALHSGQTGIAPITQVDMGGFRFTNGAEVRGFDPALLFGEKDTALLDRFAQLGLAAAAEAVADSGTEWTSGLRPRTVIVTGSSMGGQRTVDEGFHDLYVKQLPRMHPMSIPKTMSNALASHIAMRYGITGPAWSVSTACSSANHAMGQAFWMVRNGVADAAITGGSEAVFHPGFLRAWEAMRVVSPDTCRPFSADRKGLILGEGAAFLILETLELPGLAALEFMPSSQDSE